MLTLDRKKLNAVDLWITGLYAEKSSAAAAGVKDIKLVLKLDQQERLWLACGPSVPNDTVKALADALAAMNKDGSYKKISGTYLKKFAP